MNEMTLIEMVKNGLSLASDSLSAVVAAVIAALFLRRNTKTSEFEAIKARNFGEVISQLVESGKMSYLEYYKCKNFLDIAKLADERLSKTNEKSDEEKESCNRDYNFDWFIRFFDAASNISNEDMKKYWACVLAGEINNRGGFSLRAIDTLYNMSVSEANLFESLTRIVIDNKMLFSSLENSSGESVGQEINERYMFDNDSLRLLEECGLVNGLLLRNQLEILPGESYGFACGDELLLFTPADNQKVVLDYVGYPLTMVGLQLYSVVYSNSDSSYLRELGLAIRSAFPNLTVSLHPMPNEDECDEDIIAYDPSVDYFKEL